MQLTANSISFGNPTHSQKNQLLKKNYLDSIYEEFKDVRFPDNNTQTAQAELNEIVDYITDITTEINKEHLQRYWYCDQNLAQFLVNNLSGSKVDILALFKEVETDISPVILKLKYAFNRPRPSQLAYYYKLKLFPINNSKIDTPSYPSKNAILANVVCEIISNTNTDLHEKCQKLISHVQSSRIYLGVNYSTDILFSDQISKAILTNKEFAKKYQI